MPVTGSVVIRVFAFPKLNPVTDVIESVSRRLSRPWFGSSDQMQFAELLATACLPGRLCTSSALLTCDCASSVQVTGAGAERGASGAGAGDAIMKRWRQERGRGP